MPGIPVGDYYPEILRVTESPQVQMPPGNSFPRLESFFFFFLFHFLLRRPDCAEPPSGTQLQPPPCEELPGDQSAASSPTPGKTAPAECADGGAYFHVFTTVTMSQDSAAHLRFSWDV